MLISCKWKNLVIFDGWFTVFRNEFIISLLMLSISNSLF